MGGLRPATVPGRCGKTRDVQERNQRFGDGSVFHSARAQSLTREALAHVWVQKRIPLPVFLRGLGGLRGSFFA